MKSGTAFRVLSDITTLEDFAFQLDKNIETLKDHLVRRGYNRPNNKDIKLRIKSCDKEVLFQLSCSYDESDKYTGPQVEEIKEL